MAHRRRSWADRRFPGTNVAATGPLSFDLLANAPVSDSLTVTRIIGDFTLQYLVSTTVNDSLSIVDVGIGVASSAAFAVASAAGLPDPSLETEYPDRGWLYIKSLPVSQILDAAGGVSIVDRVARFEFDIRAMRKIDKGILFMILENNNITVGGAMQLTGRIRSLVLT